MGRRERLPDMGIRDGDGEPEKTCSLQNRLPKLYKSYLPRWGSDVPFNRGSEMELNSLGVTQQIGNDAGTGT